MTKIFVRDSTTSSTVYLQYTQGSYVIIRMYLCNPRVQIVCTPEYDVSCEEMRDLLPEVDKLSPNCRGVSLICWQQVAIQTLLLCEWLRISFLWSFGQSVQFCYTFLSWLPYL